MKKQLILILSLIVILIMGACEQKKDVSNNKSNVNQNNDEGKITIKDNENSVEVDTKDSDDDSNVENIEDVKIKFESFLVERCVRQALGKSWDDDVTTRELAKMKELVIQEVYNPTFLADVVHTGEGQNYQNKIYNFTYIDLSDLKYFVNLEVLKIDNINVDSMLANIDAITNCKNLKELSLLYTFTGETKNNFGGVGYLYWADIIAELPKLEKLDFSTFLDAHARDILLSKTSKKDIEFIEHDINTVGKMYWRPTEIINDIKKITDLNKYKDAWNYEYRGLEETQKIAYKKDAEGIFPYLEANSEEELKNILSSLDKNVEDIIIKISGDIQNVDFNYFARFENLITLTIFNTTESFELTEIWDDENGGYVYEWSDYEMPTIVNSSSLESNKKLQTISLIGLDGDFIGISNAISLKEVYLSACIVEEAEFKKLNNVNTLVVNYKLKNASDEKSYVLYDDISQMEKLKFLMTTDDEFTENSIVGDKVETLILKDMYYVELDWNSFELPMLKNLYLSSVVAVVDNELLTGLKNFGNLSVLKIGYIQGYLPEVEADITLLLDMENLYSVTMPFYNILQKQLEDKISDREYISKELADKIVNNKKISQFVIEYSTVEGEFMDGSYINDSFDKKIYNAGIYSGFIDKYMLARQIGDLGSSLDLAIEKHIDSLFSYDGEMLWNSLVDGVRIYCVERWENEKEARMYVMINCKNFLHNIAKYWYDDPRALYYTKYLGYTYNIMEKYNKEQINNNEKLIRKLKSDKISYEDVEEVIKVELNIEGLQKGEIINFDSEIVFIKINGRYYLWLW